MGRLLSLVHMSGIADLEIAILVAHMSEMQAMVCMIASHVDSSMRFVENRVHEPVPQRDAPTELNFYRNANTERAPPWPPGAQRLARLATAHSRLPCQ